MRTTRVVLSIATALVVTAGLAGCASNEGGTTEEVSALTGTLNGAGASSQGSAQEAWVAAFQTANPDVTVNYDPSGSGAGRESFLAGGVDFAGSDSYLKDEELEVQSPVCVAGTDLIEVPVYISPIAVIYNVEGLEELNLDAATLAGIFSGAITTWNDPKIAALNPDATLPAEAITAVHRSDDSGTTKNFADYLYQNAPEIWTEEPSDTFPFGGEGAQGTSGVVEAVTGGNFTIGYADASRAGDLGVAKLKVGDEFIEYTAEKAANVVSGSPAVDGRSASDLAVKLNRKTTNPDEYPLVLVSYAIACSEYVDEAQGTLVKAYLEFIASDEGQQVAQEQAGSAPLSADLAAKVATVLATIK